jgi:predicted dinucleotide-binding enzyme
MKIGVLGTGVVGKAIASALVSKEHLVTMGSRTAGNEKATAWVDKAGGLASEGSFNDAAYHSDLIFVCLNGEYALDMIKTIDPKNLFNKIIIDVTNPLDFTQGMPPGILKEYRTKSLGEQIQETLPASFVVKTLNTINYKLMVDARIVNDGNHNLFICGNDEDAKNKVKDLLADNFYWQHESLLDLGDIKAARCTEAIVPFWVLVWQALDTPLFNFKVVH